MQNKFPFQQELTENKYIKPITNSKINFISRKFEFIMHWKIISYKNNDSITQFILSP